MNNNKLCKDDIISFMVLQIIKKTRWVKNIKIQKIIYIYEEEIRKGLFRTDLDDLKIEFRAYKYGPFSDTVLEIINFLILMKIIKEDVTSYIITKKGAELLSLLDSKIENSIWYDYFLELLEVFKDTNSDQLLKFVYKKYEGKEILSKSTIVNNIIYSGEDNERVRETSNNIEEIKKRALSKTSR